MIRTAPPPAAALAALLAASALLAGSALPGADALPPNVGSPEDEALFHAANSDFEAGEYEQAVQKYRSLAEAGRVSPDLYFNLGTALFRHGRPGEAVLWLRRASILEPSMPEPRQSLAHLRGRLAYLDFAESGPEQLLRRFPPALARWLAALLGWSALLAAAAACCLPRARPYRKALFGAAAAAALLAASAAAASHFRGALLGPENFAIVVADSAVARTAPAPGARSVIELPPGSEVRLLQDGGAWRYAEIPGELRGWIRSEEIEALWPVPEGAPRDQAAPQPDPPGGEAGEPETSRAAPPRRRETA